MTLEHLWPFKLKTQPMNIKHHEYEWNVVNSSDLELIMSYIWWWKWWCLYKYITYQNIIIDIPLMFENRYHLSLKYN